MDAGSRSAGCSVRLPHQGCFAAALRGAHILFHRLLSKFDHILSVFFGAILSNSEMGN
jgi:hypothetical protein